MSANSGSRKRIASNRRNCNPDNNSGSSNISCDDDESANPDTQSEHQVKKTNLSGSSMSTDTTSSLGSLNATVRSGSGNPGGLNQIDVKILIPSGSAGAIIGKGGETIADIQKDTGVKIKISKANDFYPGTTERVCLVTGSVRSILDVVEFLCEKIQEHPDHKSQPAIDFDNKVTAEREKQIKMLIANTTAGMIIGKGGSFIKQIKDESGSFIQLSQKSNDTRLTERVVTIIGDIDNNLKALEMILSKVEDDPHAGSYLNISYADLQGPVANANPIGSPFAPAGSVNVANNSSMDVAMDTSEARGVETNNPFVIPLATGGALNLKFNMNPSRPPTDPALMGQYLNHMAGSLRESGYSGVATDEILQSLRCLATHGVLVVNLSSGANDSLSSRSNTPSSYVTTTNPNVIRYPRDSHFGQQQGGSFLIPSNTVNNRFFDESGYIAGQTSPHRGVPAIGNSVAYGLGNRNHSGPPPPPPGVEEQLDRAEIEVHENIVGAVIGPSGRCIVDIQQYSGTKIKISKKGSFAPGTRNRIVTISGPQESITTARRMIEHKILEEESKRDRGSF